MIKRMTKTLGGKEIEVEQKLIPVGQLSFYLDNPRLYSTFDRSLGDPTQEEIEEKLIKLEDVKMLRASIVANGGLHEPLVVRDGDFVVLEGNRRLAAYKSLSKESPGEWGRVKCTIYPHDISEDDIFRLLAQYHINGPKPWAPFEQAGVIYRRIEKGQGTVDSVSKELGLTPHRVKTYYEVYQAMVDHDELVSERWSYWVEFLTSRSLKKHRAKNPKLEKAFAAKLKSGEITDAQKEVRGMSKALAKVDEEEGVELVMDFIADKIGIGDLVEIAENTDLDLINRFERFRQLSGSRDTRRQIQRMDDEEDGRVRLRSEINRIKINLDNLLRRL